MTPLAAASQSTRSGGETRDRLSALLILELTRYAILASFALACLIALTYWAVRERHLSASNPLARFMRRCGDPITEPVARRISRFGGNPADAPFWLVAVVAVGGLIALTVVQWILGSIQYVIWASHGGSRAWIHLLINFAYFILIAAILVRVIGSWLGFSAYQPVMRLAHRLTDWIIIPLRRVLPTMGPFDFSPIVAWLVLMVVKVLLLGFV